MSFFFEEKTSAGHSFLEKDILLISKKE